MKGTMTLKVNEASIIEAMQMLVNAAYAAPQPTVEKVEIEGSRNSYGSGIELTITLTSNQPETP